MIDSIRKQLSAVQSESRLKMSRDEKLIIKRTLGRLRDDFKRYDKQ
jgi:hypothetical protein